MTPGAESGAAAVHYVFVPKYSYACKDCGHSFDIQQSFHDDPLTSCPECGGKLRKVFGNVGVVFKGSGFYRTDSRSGSTASVPASGSGSGSSSDSSGGSGSSDSSGGSSGGSGSSDSGSGGSSGSSDTPSKSGSKGSSTGSSSAPKSA